MSNLSLRRQDLFLYSFMAFPLAFAGLPLYIHAPDFYATSFQSDLAVIGLVLIAIRLFDALQDPVIGYLSDKFHHRRYQIISAGAALILAGFTGLFLGPPSIFQPIIWFALTILLATTGFSILVINLNMIGGVWSDNRHQKTRIAAWRESFTLIGLLLASILPVALQETMPVTHSFACLAYIFSGLFLISFIFFSLFFKRWNDTQDISNKKLSTIFRSILGSLISHKEFYGICFLSYLAASLPAILLIFFVRDYLNAETYTGVFLSLYFIFGALFIPFWSFLSQKIGKEKSWIISMLAAISTFIWAYFLNEGDIIEYGIICALSGIAFGANLIFPPSILADRLTTKSMVTQDYAILAFIPKAAFSIASAIAFISLDFVDFKPSGENTVQAQSTLILLYALIPCAIQMVSVIFLWKININKKEKTCHI